MRTKENFIKSLQRDNPDIANSLDMDLLYKCYLDFIYYNKGEVLKPITNAYHMVQNVSLEDLDFYYRQRGDDVEWLWVQHYQELLPNLVINLIPQ